MNNFTIKLDRDRPCRLVSLGTALTYKSKIRHAVVAHQLTRWASDIAVYTFHDRQSMDELISRIGDPGLEDSTFNIAKIFELRTELNGAKRHSLKIGEAGNIYLTHDGYTIAVPKPEKPDTDKVGVYFVRNSITVAVPAKSLGMDGGLNKSEISARDSVAITPQISKAPSGDGMLDKIAVCTVKGATPRYVPSFCFRSRRGEPFTPFQAKNYRNALTGQVVPN